jgi:hypothetical protein
MPRNLALVEEFARGGASSRSTKLVAEKIELLLLLWMVEVQEVLK